MLQMRVLEAPLLIRIWNNTSSALRSGSGFGSSPKSKSSILHQLHLLRQRIIKQSTSSFFMQNH
ncbi:hypothetical protein SOVF_149200 [Spinacia oleracea]|nr:hypothetical protein SOVF_149200 [Spinacia oleracea]